MLHFGRQVPEALVKYKRATRTYLDKEGDHAGAQVGVDVIQVLDDTLGPLEVVLAKDAAAVQRHHCGQVI